jgi:hypothetical protein
MRGGSISPFRIPHSEIAIPHSSVVWFSRDSACGVKDTSIAWAGMTGEPNPLILVELPWWSCYGTVGAKGFVLFTEKKS